MLKAASTQSIKIPGMMATALERLRTLSNFENKMSALYDLTWSFIARLRASRPGVSRFHLLFGTCTNKHAVAHQIRNNPGDQFLSPTPGNRSMAEGSAAAFTAEDQ